jgi:hypothetical protein
MTNRGRKKIHPETTRKKIKVEINRKKNYIKKYHNIIMTNISSEYKF